MIALRPESPVPPLGLAKAGIWVDSLGLGLEPARKLKPKFKVFSWPVTLKDITRPLISTPPRLHVLQPQQCSPLGRCVSASVIYHRGRGVSLHLKSFWEAFYPLLVSPSERQKWVPISCQRSLPWPRVASSHPSLPRLLLSSWYLLMSDFQGAP